MKDLRRSLARAVRRLVPPSWRQGLGRYRGAILAGAGALVALGALGIALSGTLVRRAVQSRAAGLGASVEIGRTRVGFGVVHLDDVRVTIAEIPGLEVVLDHVDAKPTLGLSLGSLAVRGGKVTLSGSVEELERRYDAYRAAHAPSGAAPGAARVVPISVTGIDVAWKGATSKERTEHCWGLRYERGADAREEAGVDLLRFSWGRSVLELSRAAVRAEREGARRIVTSLSTEGVTANVELDGEEAAEGPSPSKAEDRTEARPGRGAELRGRLGRLAGRAASLLRGKSDVSVSGLRLAVHHEGETLNVGPGTVSVSKDGERLRVKLTSGPEAKTALTLELVVPLGAGPVAVDVAGGPISLSALGVKNRDMGLFDVDRAEVEVGGRAELSEDGGKLTVSGSAALGNLSVFNPRLARDPVSGLGVTLSGKAALETDGSRVSLDGVQVGVGKLKIDASGTVERGEGHSRGALHMAVPLAACADLFASIPLALVPMLAGLETSGTFALSLDVAFDTRRPGDTKVDWDLANACRITRVPAELSPERFRAPFTRTVVGPDDRPTTIESGPGTAGWVPMFDMSPHLPTAVVVCEDARFFSHGGFDEKSIQDSIRDNLRAGKFVRGASTVSMQLAKNLFLEREKTVSRKLQEAVLTLLLEQTLTKEHILELYLNVIEFAPGLYGIGPAAAHYFRTTPHELSLAQCLYLISILPNPKIHHFQKDGNLGERWTEYLRKLMHIAHKIRKIDDQDLEMGLAETLRFGVPAEDTPRDAAPALPDGELEPPENDEPPVVEGP